VFTDEEDRHGFVRVLGEACEKTGWQVHAYCLMSPGPLISDDFLIAAERRGRLMA
jgi:hypothetical protein